MTKKKTSVSHKVLTVVGIVLCVILIPILLINLTLIAKSYINKDEVPSIAGTFPLIVLTDSMYPEIKSGDLIFCHTIDAEDIKVDDIISFFDPASNGKSIVTHRVIEIVDQNGEIFFRTRGDHNNTNDRELVPSVNLVGKYSMRIAGAGHVAMFMQSTTGLIICVVLPILLIIGYDIIRRRIYEKNKKEDTDALLAELEALRAEKAQKEKASAETENKQIPDVSVDTDDPKAEDASGNTDINGSK
ncbi:MAG: signal peptidase I [Ruminococcaceae bacterium]|nr:signal peptidase I [Oscillospiraceae bacterium]